MTAVIPARGLAQCLRLQPCLFRNRSAAPLPPAWVVARRSRAAFEGGTVAPRQSTPPVQRRAITVRGIVQGVGFRPFVYRLATGLGLSGFVRNETGCVRIEVEGDLQALDQFLAELTERTPPLAQVEGLALESLPLEGVHTFQIAPSARASACAV